MVSRRVLCWVAAAGAWLPAFAQEPLSAPPTAGDSIRAVEAPAERETVLQLVEQARNVYDLRSGGQAYDLKVRFTVNSGGLTRYDGAWQMEDVFDPQQGLRWTAGGPGTYAITRISAHGALYGEETDSYVPLRLHEARAALFDPIPAAKGLKSAAIRRAAVTFNGQRLSCFLFSGGPATSPARAWNETEECVDPESGLLRVHSQVPGRYYAYDYSNAPHLGSHSMPGKVSIYEGGMMVTQISVESLNGLSAPDPGLFVASAEMQALGRPIALGAAEKLLRVSQVKAGAPTGTVCVFGLVTASGEMVEAHSLQPSDPNSQAAVEAAQQMSFSRPAAPQQYFVFILRRFVASQ